MHFSSIVWKQWSSWMIVHVSSLGLLSKVTYSATLGTWPFQYLGSRQQIIYHSICLNLRAVGTGSYQHEHKFAKDHPIWDMMGWWVATWCFGMFSKTPTPRYGNASPSISVLTLGLKPADIVDTGSSLYNCTQLLCFNPHEPYAPLIGRVLRFAQFPTLCQRIPIRVTWLIQKS